MRACWRVAVLSRFAGGSSERKGCTRVAPLLRAFVGGVRDLEFPFAIQARGKGRDPFRRNHVFCVPGHTINSWYNFAVNSQQHSFALDNA
jgi:hypothetical protein